MNIVLNYSEGSNHEALLQRVDFINISTPLAVDMGRVLFFKPAALSLLYGIFKLHSILCPDQERRCIPANLKSEDTDVNRYVQRVNFFKCCSEFEQLREEKFGRHDPYGRFVPITEIQSMHETDSIAEQIVKIIFSKSSAPGEAQVKYILTELMDNALQHSESRIGCIAQAQLYAEKFVEGVILDCGMGIRNHLSRNKNLAIKITSDEKAIELALEPYVSGASFRGKSNIQEQTQGYHNEGLGLSVCKELMRRSGGFLQIISGKAGLKITQSGTSKIRIAGWPGTLIVFRINCQQLTSIHDIIKEFDKLKPKRDNSPAGHKGPEFL